MARTWWGKILAEHDTEPTEFSGGLLKVLVGAWLLMPWSTFASSPTFETVEVIPEWAWGSLLVTTGIGHWLALRNGSVRWRRLACLIGFVFWFAFGTTFWIANPRGFAVVVYGLLAAQQGWAYVRLTILQRVFS